MSSPFKPGSPFECLDCGRDTNAINEYYMVKYDVWKQATGDNPNGMLCIGCLEQRIGRHLQRSDFTEHMDNMSLFTGLSRRLRNRLGKDQ
jgi:hypothetical protein